MKGNDGILWIIFICVMRMTGVLDGINNDVFGMNCVFVIGELVIKDNNRNED